jgi:hypothetical protein
MRKIFLIINYCLKKYTLIKNLPELVINYNNIISINIIKNINKYSRKNKE